MKKYLIPFYIAIFLITLSVIWWKSYPKYASFLAGLGILNLVAYRILKRKK